MIFKHSELHPRDVAIIHNHPVHYKHLLFGKLQERGLKFCVLFAAAEINSRHEKIDIAACEYECLILSPEPFGAGGLRQVIETAARTWTSLNCLNPRVVVLGGYHMVATWTGWVWAGIHRRRRILWFESNSFDWPRVVWKEWVKRVFVLGCGGAHTYGVSSKTYLVKLGMAPEQIGIKRAVVDIARFAGVRHREVTEELAPVRRLIYVGRLAAEKNLPFVFRALQELALRGESPPFRLVVVGTGPKEAKWRALVNASHIESTVDFVGFKSQAELCGYYGESDVLILPSTREPYGLVVLEAMVAGLPVLVSDQCGCAADVVTPETGWTFSPSVLESLVARLIDISHTPTERLRQMGAAAREVAAEYGPDDCADRVMSLVGASGVSDARKGREAWLAENERL